jgi:hypothetical protein
VALPKQPPVSLQRFEVDVELRRRSHQCLQPS